MAQYPSTINLAYSHIIKISVSRETLKQIDAFKNCKYIAKIKTNKIYSYSIDQAKLFTCDTRANRSLQRSSQQATTIKTHRLHIKASNNSVSRETSRSIDGFKER